MILLKKLVYGSNNTWLKGKHISWNNKICIRKNKKFLKSQNLQHIPQLQFKVSMHGKDSLKQETKQRKCRKNKLKSRYRVNNGS